MRSILSFSRRPSSRCRTARRAHAVDTFECRESARCSAAPLLRADLLRSAGSDIRWFARNTLRLSDTSLGALRRRRRKNVRAPNHPPPPEVRGTSRGHDHCVAASLGVANPAPGPAELTAALELAILDSAWSPRAVLVKNLLRGHLWAFGPFANPVEAIEYAERIPSDIFGPTGGNIEVLVLPLELP